jgi:acyl-CoA thioesterase
MAERKLKGYMDKIKKFFSSEDKFARHCGIEIVEVKSGYALVRMPIKEFHFNGLKTVHGGALFTLADFAFAIASNSHGTAVVAIHVDISYLKAISQGVLTAEAREISSEARIVIYSIEVRNQDKELIALFQGTGYKKKNSLDEFYPKES